MSNPPLEQTKDAEQVIVDEEIGKAFHIGKALR